jgi:hypothetical protein
MAEILTSRIFIAMITVVYGHNARKVTNTVTVRGGYGGFASVGGRNVYGLNHILYGGDP